MKLSLWETNYTVLTANFLANLGPDSETENNNAEHDNDSKLDVFLDEAEVNPNQPSGTCVNATEPEVSPNQPSGTGSNANEPEVLLVLDLHDEACENAVTTD